MPRYADVGLWRRQSLPGLGGGGPARIPQTMTASPQAGQRDGERGCLTLDESMAAAMGGALVIFDAFLA